jgi:UDP-N-acetylglucosamine--N-acetylmuramyl-(pentapeptide) pyrophosphoryl-undecaprenol N-acetylglucosamine transferase
MKIVIVGGHLSPALAVIDRLKDVEIFYIGRKFTFEGDRVESLEYTEITKRNIPLFSINAARLQRKFTRYTAPSLFKLPLGFFQAYKILKNVKPDIVLGFGGYLSISVAFAARILKIPVVIHEQTLEIGFANKLISGFSQKNCISWQSSEQFFPKSNTVLTGNPLRKEVLEQKGLSKNVNNPPLLYITGGSAGSHAINLLIEKTLPALTKKFSIFHQTGDSKYKDFERLEKFKSDNYECRKFLSPKESASILLKADLIIGRSGINTVTELLYLEKPGFLIPLPFAQREEQLKNAVFFKNLGLGEYLKQDGSLTPELFVSKITEMFARINSYKLKEKVIVEDAADKIITIIKDVSKKA